MKPASPKVILVLSYLTFLFFGAFTAAIGPVLGELAQRTGSPLASIGGVLTFLFAGAIVAQVFAGPITDRFGHKAVLVASLLVLAAGMAGFTNARVLAWMFVLALFGGLGQGGVDMGANLVVADAAPRNTTSALNLLHFFFGLGAFIGPALVGISIALAGSGLVVLWGIAGLFALLAAAMAVLLEGGARPGPQDAPAGGSASGGFRTYLSPLLWLLAILMLVYVGVEIALGSWVSAYMGITTGLLPQFGAWVTSAYWAALALGRLAGAAASSKLTRMQLLAVALSSSLLGGIGLFISSGTVVATIACLAWIGFSYGTVYPTTVAVANSAFSQDRGKAVSLLVAMGSVGAAGLPLVAGRLLENSTPLGYLWFVTLSLAALLLILAAISPLMSRQADPAGV